MNKELADKIIRLSIKDTEDNGVLYVFYLVNPDMKKLEYLQDRISARFDLEGTENEYSDSSDAIVTYIKKNFKLTKMVNDYTIWW